MTVLVVDDDLGTLESFRLALRSGGFEVVAACSGAEAIAAVNDRGCDLMVVDLCLPDVQGLQLIRRLRELKDQTPFVVISGFVNIPLTVEAMQMGAFDVLEKPIDIDKLVRTLRRAASVQGSSVDTFPNSLPLPATGERWSKYVLRASDSDRDLKTIEDWARVIGVSYSSLCESCRLLSIPPHHARDMARTLRAVVKSSTYNCSPTLLLDVSDRRTLKLLVERAGPAFRLSRTIEHVNDFIATQRFVPQNNLGIIALLRMLPSRSAGLARQRV
jgi:DNA-binding response OmpR family regulator